MILTVLLFFNQSCLDSGKKEAILLGQNLAEGFKSQNFKSLVDQGLVANNIEIVVSCGVCDFEEYRGYRFKKVTEFENWYKQSLFARSEKHLLRVFKENLTCKKRKCEFKIEGATMHHAIYLTGYTVAKEKGKWVIDSISISEE